MYQKIIFLQNKRIIRLFLMFVSVVFVCACSHFDRKTIEFRDINPLKAEMVDLNEILAPDFMTLKGNNLVISSSRSTPTMLFTYSTPSLAFNSVFGSKGQGPEEIQLRTVRMQQERI